MSYTDVEDARLHGVQNSWGPSDECYLAPVRAAGTATGTGGPLTEDSPEIVAVARSSAG